MEILLIALLLVALFYCILLWKKVQNTQLSAKNTVRLAREARAADNALVISVLAREIANELMQREFSFYRNRFDHLYSRWMEIQKGEETAKLAHLSTITSKYRTFFEFDELGTKAHVLYADGFSWKSNDDLWDLYEALRLFDALSCDLDDEWKQHGCSISEKEREHLNEYCKKLSDTMLLAHLHKARDIYFMLNSIDVKKNENAEWIYETTEYKIKRVYNVAESRFGVYVKSMNRCGIWGLFIGDFAYTSFFAADDDFNEMYLDDLQMRVCVGAGEYRKIEKHKW